MWSKRLLWLVFFAFFLGLLCAQDLDIISSIDQAIEQLNTIEQNNINLKDLLNKREATIIEKDSIILEKERSLNLMTQQFQNLEVSLTLSRKWNKIKDFTILILALLVTSETIYIVGDKAYNWW